MSDTRLEVWTADELMNLPIPLQDWGGWKLDGCELAYPVYGGGGEYPVDLTRFTSSAQVLDMIMQVAGKKWATDKCVAGLVRALDDLLQPQAHLCSGGSDKRITRTQIKKLLKLKDA